jgi:hypothetical protein
MKVNFDISLIADCLFYGFSMLHHTKTLYFIQLESLINSRLPCLC